MSLPPRRYRWEHAVNSRELLDKVSARILAATADAIEFPSGIEADVIWSEPKQQPVMGHPPQTDSELTLLDFLAEMTRLSETLSQAHVNDQRPLLIVKLDFKSMHAFQAAKDPVQSFIESYPFTRGVFINADILIGPANTKDLAFDGMEFLRIADSIDQRFPSKIVVSVGWTTSNSTQEEMQRPYTDAMIDEMLTLLKPFGSLYVTFPLRATSIRNSWESVKILLDASEQYGFTLWWAITQLTNKEIDWLYTTLEDKYTQRTFYDIRGFDTYLAKRTRKNSSKCTIA